MASEMYLVCRPRPCAQCKQLSGNLYGSSVCCEVERGPAILHQASESWQ